MSGPVHTRSRDVATAVTAPGGLPLAGHALLMIRRPLGFLASLPSFGDLVSVRLGTQRVYVPCTPELTQKVLLDARVFDSGGPTKDKARPILGNGLITSDWADHRRQRRLVQPAFHSARIAAYAEVMQREADAESRSWQAGEVLDVSDAMQRLTARVTARALFATDIREAAVTQIQRGLPVIVRGAYRRAMDPTGLVARLPLPANRRFERCLTGLHRLIDRIIAVHRESGRDRGDVLSALLEATEDGQGGRFTDQEVHDQVMTLLMAGIETTSSALAWTFHLLSRHPAAESELHAELDAVLGERSPGYADLPRLDYTHRLFKEALRLYPPAWMFTRTTTEATVLAGEHLPAGTDLLVSPYVLHHDARLFPDPERFDPDRWLPERAKEVTKGSYLPFGTGSHKCIGDVFATTEAVLALAAITRRWRLRPPAGAEVKAQAHMSLTPGRLLMAAHPR